MAKAAFGGGTLASLRASFGDDTGTALKLRLDQVEEDPDQPRKVFDAAGLEELAATIRLAGVLQPIAVRPLEGQRYRLVYGARRLRASHLAGRTHIPAYIVEDEQAGLAAQVIENQLRADLSNSDLAAAIARLHEGGMKLKEIAVVTGLPDWRLRHYRAVPTLPPFLARRLDRADIRGLYELQGAWEKAKEEVRSEIEEAVGRLPEDETLTVTEARRVIEATTGKPTHSIALDRQPQAPDPAREEADRLSSPAPSVPSLPAESAEAHEYGGQLDESQVNLPSAERPSPRPEPTAGGGRVRFMVEADGRRGSLVTDRRAPTRGTVLVQFGRDVVEVACADVRLVEVR